MSQQQICIGDILEPFEELLGERPEPELLTLTEKNGFIAQSQKYNKRVARDDTSDYKVIRRFDIAFNPYLLWAGAIAQNVDWDIALISPLYPTFHVRTSYDPRFIDYLLRGDSLRLRYDTISFGSVPRKRRASVTDFLNLKLPKPPSLSKQQYIADILDRAEALRAKRRAVLAQLDELTQSIFIEMFGDPVKNPKSWDTTKLGKCTEFITSGSRGWAKYYSETGEKFIRIQNVRNGRLDFSDIQLVEPPKTAESIRTKVKDGDLLISITADLGRTAVVDEKTALEGAYINQHLALIRLNKKIVDPVFVSQYLESEGGKRQFSSLDQKGVKSGLNFENVKSLEFYLPPLDMQKEFSLRATTLEKLKAAHKASLAELDELFASLQYRAFRGEL